MTAIIPLLPTDVSITVGHGDTLRAFQQLVFEQYVEHGWLNPEEHPSRRAKDKFDPHSTALVFTSQSRVVGGTRLVPDSRFGFPHEAGLGLTDDIPTYNEYHELLRSTPRDKIIEITRVVGRIRHTTLFYNLAKALYWHHRFTGYTVYPMLIDERLCKLGWYINMPIYQIGKPLECEGSITIPTITIPGLYPQVVSHPKYGWDYIRDTSNLDQSWTTAFMDPETKNTPIGVV